MKLTVIYDKKGQIDANLDQKVIRALDALGFKFHGSGCNRLSGERDLTFDNED